MSTDSVELGRGDVLPRAAIACLEPSTRAPLGTVRVDTPEDVAAAVRAARAAQARWKDAPFAVRRRVLERVLAHVVDHADELCELVCRVSGKTRENAMMGEIWPVAEKLRWTIANGERHLRPEAVSSGLLVHKRATIEYAPRGVVGAIVPWNYPLQNIMNPAIPALMAGNGAVVKASEWVAWSSARFQRIFDEALSAEGFSPALVRVLNGFGETGAALVRSSGEAPTARRRRHGDLHRLGAERAPCARGRRGGARPGILELGGKDPLLVCDDADLEQPPTRP